MIAYTPSFDMLEKSVDCFLKICSDNPLGAIIYLKKSN